MEKLTSIYNFVPLNAQVFYPSWANQVSQDAPFSDGEDGYIDVTLHNVSPLFIRNGSADRNNSDPYSAHVMKDGKRLYFLPATSVKGMLRSTLEIMSFGKMTQYTNRFFSKRELGGQYTPDGKAYVALMEDVKPAWLRMKSEELFLTPCSGDYLRCQKNIRILQRRRQATPRRWLSKMMPENGIPTTNLMEMTTESSAPVLLTRRSRTTSSPSSGVRRYL